MSDVAPRIPYPTLGRIVIFHESLQDYQRRIVSTAPYFRTRGPFAAVVTRVVDGWQADLTVFFLDGPRVREGVTTIDGKEPGHSGWTWPPRA